MFSSTISLAPPLARPATRPAALPGFAAGTLLRTITGPRAVERIMAGDLLLDRDGQIIELRSLHQRHAPARALVEITTTALGTGHATMPDHGTLLVGAGQKLEIRDWRSDLIYGEPVLTKAQALIDQATVTWSRRSARLYCPGFDRDCVIMANGVPALVRASET